jgi:hypothetical protein
VCKHERPRPEARGAVEDQWHDHSTASAPSDQDPIRPAAGRPQKVAGPVGRCSLADIARKLAWDWSDLEALLGLSRRLLQREVSAGRMPAHYINILTCLIYRPSTIQGWLDAMAVSQGRRRP